MQIALTTLSSKGQIVIPSELREDMKEGEKLVIIKDGHRLILKKASELDKQLKEDLEFAKRTEEAWKQIDEGKCRRMGVKEFLKEIESW